MQGTKKFIFVILASMFSFNLFLTTSDVFGAAGSNAPSSPSTCQLYGTCYGAGWEHYNKTQAPRGTKKLANGNIQVYGTTQGAGSGIIEASKCEETYWRLAWYVAYSATASNGIYYGWGEQIGIMSLKEASGYGYNINSMPGSGSAKAAWDSLSNAEKRGYSWDNNSGLAWFCGERTDTGVTLSAVGKIYGQPNTIVWTTSELGASAFKKVASGSNATVAVPARLTKNGKVYEFKTWGTSCHKSNNRQCTEEKMSTDYTVAAHYVERPLPCGGVCGSELKLTLNHDNGQTEDSIATISTGVQKTISGSLKDITDATGHYGALYVKPGEVSATGSFKPDYQPNLGRHPSQLSIIDADAFGDSTRHRANSSKNNHDNSEYPSMYGWNNNPDLATTIQQYVGNFYNAKYTDLSDSLASKGKSWNNAFSIATTDSLNGAASSGVDCTLVNGVIGSNSEYSRTITKQLEVGHRVNFQSRVNDNEHCRDGHITPRSIAYEYYDDIYERAVINNTGTRTIRIETYIPYNFINRVSSIKNKNSSNVVFAGGTASVEYEITSDPKYNAKVGDTYLTNVPEAKVKVRYRYSGSGGYILGEEKSLGSIGATSKAGFSTSPIKKNGSTFSVSVPDLNAGEEVCISIGVWPASSGDDANWTNPVGDNEWSWSGEVCFTVAKRPNFQIWGGNLYSNGKIDLSINEKKIKISGDEENTYVFSPWVELGLIANGPVTGLASGAGTGYGVSSDASNLASSPSNVGGSKESGVNYCNRSTLSFANNNCSNSVGNLGSVQFNASSDRSDLVSRFSDSGGTEYKLLTFDSEGVDISDPRIGNTDNFSGDMDGGVLKTTKVIKTNGDVTIDKNITYKNNGYNTLESIPKIIIYAKNIKINCGVARIDAVLIADGNIDTCANETNINAKARSNQLIINGSTISNTLTLGRTYGAATGLNSIIPAEIINYDSSLLLWANQQTGSSGTGKLKEAITHELSPRY